MLFDYILKHKNNCYYIQMIATVMFQVALQFPDWLLHDAAKVATILTRETSQIIFILADTSYGRLEAEAL